MTMLAMNLSIQKELTEDEIREIAPDVFSLGPANNRALTSKRVMAVLNSKGFSPVDIATKKIRVKRNWGQPAPYMLRFARKEDIKSQRDRAELVIFYNPDPKNNVLYHIFAGYRRLVSDQPMVMGPEFHQVIFATDDVDTALVHRIEYMIDTKLPELEFRIAKMRKLDITHKECQKLAIQAIYERWQGLPEGSDEDKPEKGVYAVEETLIDALLSRRNEDRDDDLWTVYSRVQEAVMGGIVRVLSITANVPEGRLRDARPVADIDLIISVNQAIWEHAMAIMRERMPHLFQNQVK